MCIYMDAHAGRDTTAITLTFVLYELSRNPEAEARVLQEIGREVGPGPLTMANLGALEYTKRVIMETLRLYPPGEWHAWFAVLLAQPLSASSLSLSDLPPL